MAKKPAPKRRSTIAKDLGSRKYRPRVIPNKKRQAKEKA